MAERREGGQEGLPRAANLTGTATRIRGGTGSKGKGKGKNKGKSETRHCYDCGGQGHIGASCPYKWANNIDEEDDQASSWESELEGENAEELASLETPDEEGEWRWPIEEQKHHLVSRNAGEAQWTWKIVTVEVDSGAAENVMPRGMFPERGISQTERSRNGEGVQRTREREHQ